MVSKWYIDLPKKANARPQFLTKETHAAILNWLFRIKWQLNFQDFQLTFNIFRISCYILVYFLVLVGD